MGWGKEKKEWGQGVIRNIYIYIYIYTVRLSLNQIN
jgi:hypothetical protein